MRILTAILPTTAVALLGVSSGAQERPRPATPPRPPAEAVAPVAPRPHFPEELDRMRIERELARASEAVARAKFDGFGHEEHLREVLEQLHLDQLVDMEHVRLEIERASEVMENMRIDELVHVEMERAVVEEQLSMTFDELQHAAVAHAPDAFVFDDLRHIAEMRAVDALSAHAEPLWIHLPESPYPQDVADSLYKAAREMLNRGEYRRAAEAFRVIGQRYPSSRYAQDVLYYEAFALYRIGTVADMQAALRALEQQRERFPRASVDREAASLATRIRGELAAHGDARAQQALESQVRAPVPSRPGAAPMPPSGRAVAVMPPGGRSAQGTAASQSNCDRDELAVRLEALSALSRIESPEVTPALRRVLQRRDECSTSLRSRAVLLLGRQTTPETGEILLEVAKSDPELSVQRQAIDMLGKIPTDRVVSGLQEILLTGNTRLAASVMRALNANENPRARQAVRTVIERNDIAEQTRVSALSSFTRATPEEAAYLRGVYPKLESRRLRSQAITTIARLPGPENQQWLMALVRNEGEAMELRSEALGRLASNAPLPEVSRLYDQVSDRRLKERIITSLSNRNEPEAVDKLISIARNDQDQQLRRHAISRLSRKTDPRTTQLLLEIINR
ncbi:MAG TPA: HEAT repeat domain-containing protein [Gemmatimonadaceae bacterium]|nr:HEAT repeat domain-containing protein [Gemmatimonadaceae bacterium]